MLHNWKFDSLLVFFLDTAWLKPGSTNKRHMGGGNCSLIIFLQLYHHFLWCARVIFVRVQHCHLPYIWFLESDMQSLTCRNTHNTCSSGNKSTYLKRKWYTYILKIISNRNWWVIFSDCFKNFICETQSHNLVLTNGTETGDLQRRWCFFFF